MISLYVLRQLLTTFLSNGQDVGWKKRFQNDLFCVKRGVKLLTQSINQAVNHLNDFGAAYCSFLEHTPRCCPDRNPEGSVNIQYGSSSYGTCRKRRRPSVISGFGHDRVFLLLFRPRWRLIACIRFPSVYPLTQRLATFRRLRAAEEKKSV